MGKNIYQVAFESLDIRPLYLENSYLTSEQCLHQFCLTNLFLRAKLNKTVANFAHILEIDWPLSSLTLILEYLKLIKWANWMLII